MWIRSLIESVCSPTSLLAARKTVRDAWRKTGRRLCVEALEDRRLFCRDVTGAGALLVELSQSPGLATAEVAIHSASFSGRLHDTARQATAAASIAVSDVTLFEGNAGSQYAEVVVTLSRPLTTTVRVDYTTADGTAKAGSDFQAGAGKVLFAPGETSRSILVPVKGDRLGEVDEHFLVKISGAKGAKIADDVGVVTILDDEPRISIDDVAGVDWSSGVTHFTFTVSLSAESTEAVTIDFATTDGTAKAGYDYVATSGRLTFAPGETAKTITVEVIGDNTSEEEEAFFVNLSGASAGAILLDGQGLGRIADDLPDQPGDPGEGCTPDNPYFPNC